MNAIPHALIAPTVMSILCALLLVAVWNDVKQYRIPNKLVFVGAALGLLLNSVLPEGQGFVSDAPGAIGLLKALAGLGVGLAIMLPLYILRAMGAGDVKLMAMVGAFLGPQATIGAILLTFAIGGAMSLLFAVKHKSLARLLSNVSTMLKTSAFKILFFNEIPTLDPAAVSAGRLPYGVAIAAGTISYFVLVRYTSLFNFF